MTTQPFLDRTPEAREAASLDLPVNPFGALTAGLPQVMANSDYVIDSSNFRHRDLRKAFGSGHILLYNEQSQLLGSLAVFLCLQATPEAYGRAPDKGFRVFSRKRGYAGGTYKDYASVAVGDREGFVISDPTVNLVIDCVFPDTNGVLPSERPGSLPRFTPVRAGTIHSAYLWMTNHAALEQPLTGTTLADLDQLTPPQFDAANPQASLVWLTLPMGGDAPLNLNSAAVDLSSGLMLLQPIWIELDADRFSGGSTNGAAYAVIPEVLRCGASVDTLPDNTRHCGAIGSIDPETGINAVTSTTPDVLVLRWGGYIRSSLLVPPTGKYYFEASFPAYTEAGTGRYDGLCLVKPEGPARGLNEEWDRNGSFYRYSHGQQVRRAPGERVGFYADREAATLKPWTPEGWMTGGVQCYETIRDNGPLAVGFGRNQLAGAEMGGSWVYNRRDHFDRSVAHFFAHDMGTFTYDLPMGYEPLPLLKNGVLNTAPYPYDYPMDWLSASAADPQNHPVIWQLKTRSTFVLPPSAQIVSALTVPGEGSYAFAVTCPELNGEPVELAEGEVAHNAPALGIALVPNDSPASSLAEAEAAGYVLHWLADSPALQAAGGRVEVQVDVDAGSVSFAAGSTELLTAPMTGTGPWRIVVGTGGSGDPEGRITAALDFDTDRPLPNTFSRAWA